MIRIEIFANHSVEENIHEALAKEGVGKHYTKIPHILGNGSSGPRLGDSIWPEENLALIIWCSKADAKKVQKAVARVKEKFPAEGITMFATQGAKVL
ncbi:MAG: hypothetical protein FWG66_03635 [Spirochaetes bacterium]|nr:hypothetical protein [Spirochaetota bacterium]